MRSHKIVAFALLVTGSAFLGACSDNSGPSASANSQPVTLSVSAGGVGPAAAAPESVSVGGHTIVLSKVEVVLRRIQLKRVDGSIDCDGESGSTDDSPSASSGPNGGSGDDDECEEVAVGPMLLNLPLGGGTKRVVTVDIDTGTYRRVEFKVQKPESNDQAFLAANPDFSKVSIRATGTYDGKGFVFTTDLNAKQRSALVPPLVVADGTKPTDLTLSVDVRTWFATSAGLLDPASGLKGAANENQIRDNIRRSFRLFCDRDHDGREDR